MSASVLVTGGAGYVGSHACKALAASGYIPVTLDNLATGHREAVRWGPLEQLDVRDRAGLDEVFARYRPVAVFHFAAWIRVDESVRDPLRYYENNVLGTLSLLEACRAAAVNHFILSSTAAIYGDPRQLPIPEDHPPRPLNPYGSTKLLAERLLADFEQACGIRSCALRYFNAAGLDPDCELGRSQWGRSHLIPTLLEVASGRRETVKIYGDDYPTNDGTCVRDYVHVSDLARGHVDALDHLLGGGASGVWNLGTGRGYSVYEILEATRRVTGQPIPVEMAERRPGDSPVSIADDSKARSELSWSPQFIEPEEMIQHQWRWMTTHADLMGEAARGPAVGAPDPAAG